MGKRIHLTWHVARKKGKTTISKWRIIVVNCCGSCKFFPMGRMTLYRKGLLKHSLRLNSETEAMSCGPRGKCLIFSPRRRLFFLVALQMQTVFRDGRCTSPSHIHLSAVAQTGHPTGSLHLSPPPSSCPSRCPFYWDKSCFSQAKCELSCCQQASENNICKGND